jgi:hypothetical protein
MMIHDLKIHPGPFTAVLDGTKTHEIRKADRPFEVGDVLHLREWDPVPTEHAVNEPPVYARGYTGRECRVEVTHISRRGTWGLPADLCVMSIRLVGVSRCEDCDPSFGCFSGNAPCSKQPKEST